MILEPLPGRQIYGGREPRRGPSEGALNFAGSPGDKDPILNSIKKILSFFKFDKTINIYNNKFLFHRFYLPTKRIP